MGKRRIYEAAKDLGVDSKELVKKLQDIGIEVKSHSSTVDEDDIKRALAKPAAKPEAGPKRPGMVVRKKADIPVAPVVEQEESQEEQYAQSEQDQPAAHHQAEDPRDEAPRHEAGEEHQPAQHAQASHQQDAHGEVQGATTSAESATSVNQEAQSTDAASAQNTAHGGAAAAPGAPGSAAAPP